MQALQVGIQDSPLALLWLCLLAHQTLLKRRGHTPTLLKAPSSRMETLLHELKGQTWGLLQHLDCNVGSLVLDLGSRSGRHMGPLLLNL
jgi:hypothetical protein